MHVEFSLTRDDVENVLRQFVPLEIELGGVGNADRVVALDDLTDVALVPDAGVRIQCAARLRWPLLGIEVPVHVQKLGILLIPSVRARDGQESLVFKLKIEDADIAWIPALVDQNITERVNRDLAEHNVELAWNFSHTLSHVFKLPAALKTAASLGLEVTAGQVRVTESSLGLLVSFRAAVGRRVAPG